MKMNLKVQTNQIIAKGSSSSFLTRHQMVWIKKNNLNNDFHYKIIEYLKTLRFLIISIKLNNS